MCATHLCHTDSACQAASCGALTAASSVADRWCAGLAIFAKDLLCQLLGLALLAVCPVSVVVCMQCAPMLRAGLDHLVKRDCHLVIVVAVVAAVVGHLVYRMYQIQTQDLLVLKCGKR